MNYSPLFPHHIFYPMRLCVVQNKSLWGGWGGEEKRAIKGLGIHQVPGMLVVLGLGVRWPQACLLWSEGNPSYYPEEVFWREGFKFEH